MRKLLLGIAIAIALTTASYAQDFRPLQVQAREAYDSGMNETCRTNTWDIAIWHLENAIHAMEGWIGSMGRLLNSVALSDSDDQSLRDAADRNASLLKQAESDVKIMKVWLAKLYSKPSCPTPPVSVPVIPGGNVQNGPTTPPAGANCVVPQGRIRPILVATDPTRPGWMGVIWMDEQGNQFVAIYNADGASTWDGGGTPPEQPSAQELSKAGSLSGSAFREYQQRLPKKACQELVPQEPEKTQKVEQPHKDINWSPPPIVDESWLPPVLDQWHVRPDGTRERSDRSEKSDHKSTRDTEKTDHRSDRDIEKSDAKSNSNSEHSNGRSVHNSERANAKPENGSEHTTRTVAHQLEESHQISHTTGAGSLSGMHEMAMHEGPMRMGGLVGTHMGGLGGMHLGGLGGLHRF